MRDIGVLEFTKEKEFIPEGLSICMSIIQVHMYVRKYVYTYNANIYTQTQFANTCTHTQHFFLKFFLLLCCTV